MSTRFMPTGPSKAPLLPPIRFVRYVLLGAALCILADQVWVVMSTEGRPRRATVANVILLLMSVLQILAFFFKWPRRVSIVLWAMALIWTAFAGVYVLYLEDLLYP